MLRQVDPDYVSKLNSVGILFFSARDQLDEEFPLKVYRIDHTWGTIWDHAHDYVQIWYVNKGAFDHSIGSHRYRVVAGNLFVIPPYTVHRVDMLPGEELLVTGCEFMPEVIDSAYRSPSDAKPPPYADLLSPFLVPEEHVRPKVTLTGDDDLTVRRLLDEMLCEHTEKPAFLEAHLRAGLMKLLAVLLRVYSADMEHDLSRVAGEHRRMIAQCINYIHQYYAEDLRLEDMYRRALVSRTTFCQLFKEMTGKTFSAYVNDLRIRRAMRLLLDPSLTVNEVSYRVGFNNVSYFSRRFKQVVGLSPSRYREEAVRQTVEVPRR